MVKKTPKKRVSKQVDNKPGVTDNIIKRAAYATGGKHVPKVRDDVEARKQEIKKADEGNMTYGRLS